MSKAATTLGALLPDAFGASSDAPRAIAGIASDSRKVKPGFLFVAVPGSKADGSQFIAAAVTAGAVAVIGEGLRPAELPAHVAYAQVLDVRQALSMAASRFCPDQPEVIVAVTGTSGKSSVAEFTRQIFAALGHPAASLGTIGVVAPSGAHYGSLTTPDPVSLHETLHQLAGEGVTHLAMEASSHGLDQRRLDGVRLKAAGFTNLGRDHLDYHADMDEYFAAKRRLFDTLLPESGVAVVNVDDAYGPGVIEAAKARGIRTFTVGEKGRDLRLIGNVRKDFAQVITLETPIGDRRVTLPLVGAFQVSNALVAAGLAIAAGEDAASVIKALPTLTGVKGRLERVAVVNGGLAIVDYAHKPDALENVLKAVRSYATGRLITVFGCGGDRDKGKRPLMGEIAVRLSDIAIVTDDNPRSEDPAAIRAEILAAAVGALEVGDRGEAIRKAVRILQPGDVLVVAGKGHETGQIVGDTTLPFSDHDAIRAAIEEMAA